jgi:hypothetical protein
MSSKEFIKLFIPPIFYPSSIKNIYANLFRENNRFEYEKNFYSRHSFILRSILNKKKDCNYLEIGVSDDDVFNTIPLNIENKIGVDPNKGGTHRMTSDEFFNNNKKYFDVIFIDGLHTFEQCKKDFLNCLKFINEDGIIIFHDMLPRNSFEEAVPRKSLIWNGDVWKLAVEISSSTINNFRIANIDRGVGMFKFKKNFKFKNIENIEDKNFEDLVNEFHKNLPIVNSFEALQFLDS